MIAALAFSQPVAAGDGRLLRTIGFEARSTLPLSAACLVANGVREQLARLLAADIDVELTEPAMPSSDERRVLLDGATIVRVRGRIGDGFVVVRAADARRLVALAFGEPERERPLSVIERATLERIVAGLVPLCNTLSGTLGPVVRETPERAVCDIATYFEVRTTGAIRLAVGFALAADPPETVAGCLGIDDLADVELAGTVEFASGSLAVPAFSRLAPGATIALETPLGAPGTLRFGDVAFAAGTCGVTNGRSAIAFGDGSIGTYDER